MFKNLFTRRYATYRRFNHKVYNTNLLMNPQARKYGAIAVGGLGLFYVANLEEAPITHRKRFLWVSPATEKFIGDYTYKQLLAEHRGQLLPQNHPYTVKIRGIFQRILKVSPIDETSLDWRVHVINDPRAPPNAFVLPGGKVFVFSSILPICQNEDGLATVLSHEFGHQLARHTGEQISKSPIYGILGLLLYTLTGADLLNSLVINAVFKMPASREMETEADYIGLMLMSKACFDPNEAHRLWERMANWERSAAARAPPEFLSTHPASSRRIQNMNEWLPAAMAERAKGHCDDFAGFSDFGRTSVGGYLPF